MFIWVKKTIRVIYFLLRWHSVGKDFHLNNVHVKSGYEDDVHFVKFNGDFGEGELNGHIDWATLPQSFVNYVGSRLPTMPGLPQDRHPTYNNFMLTMRMTDAEWLQKILGIPFDITKQMEIEAAVDDHQHTIDINL